MLGSWAASISSVYAQFVPPPTDLIATKGYLDIPVRYKEVPTGTCELDPDVKSFSGYVDVAEDQHYFFWFLYGLSFFFYITGFFLLDFSCCWIGEGCGVWRLEIFGCETSLGVPTYA